MTQISLKKKTLFSLIALISLALLTTIFLEMSLRVAALFVGQRSIVPTSSGKNQVILCLGDSHTYGVSCLEDEAYPGQLQTILERRAPGRYHVLNLGLPGMNPSQIAVRLADWIEQYRPQSVVLCAGINGYWNRSDTEERRQEGAVSRWLYELRVYRLYRLVGQRFVEPPSIASNTGRPELKRIVKNDGKGGIEHRNAKTGEPLIAHKGRGVGNRTNPEVVDLLQKEFTNILEVTRIHNVQLIFLTYAGFELPGRNAGHRRRINLINEETRNFSRQHGQTLVDVRQRFLELIPKGASRAMYFLTERESHPNPAGYFEVATLVANVFEPDTESEARVNMLIDLGTPEARQYMQNGWSKDEKTTYGTGLVWGEGKKSTLEFFFSETREIQLIFRCKPFRYPGSPTQTISISINGEKIERIISLEPGFTEYQIVLPPQAVVAGKNRLEFHYAYNRVVKEVLPGTTGTRSLAVVWDYIRLVVQSHDNEDNSVKTTVEEI